MALLLILGAGTARADGPPVRVLASSGTVVGDAPIARFDRPGEMLDGRIVFRGVSTAVVVERDGIEHPYLRTGDVLPAPLDGTVNEIVDVAANVQGTIVVAADVNSNAATGVILLDEGAGPSPVVTSSDDPEPVGLAINAANDLLYWTTAALSVRLAAAGSSQTIGTLAGRRLRLRPLLDDGPRAAWMVDKPGALSYWSPDSGTIPIAAGRFRRSGRARPGLALDGRFGVAYVRPGSVDGAFLWSVSSRTTSTLARLKDRVGDRSIFRFRGPIAFLDDGAVAFEADLRGARKPRILRTYVRAKDGTLALTDPPLKPPVIGPHLRLDRRAALFSVDGTGVTPLVRPGDPIDGGGTVASVESHAARNDRVAAIVTTEDGREVVVRRRGTHLVPLEQPDSLGSGLLYVTRRTTVVLGDELVLVGRRRLVTLEPPKERPADAFAARAVAVGGDRLFALGMLGECDGIFIVRRRRLAHVLTAGVTETCRRRARLAIIDAIAASSRQLVAIGGEGDARRGLYLVRRRGITRLGSDIGGTSLDPLAVALAGERPIFVADSPQDPSLRQLFIAGTPAPTPLLREGDPTAVGDVHFDPSDVFGGPAENEVLVTATVRGSGVRRALVAQSLPR